MYNEIVDKITEYINKARSLGNTDDQIKQTLLNNGWQASIINPYFTSLPPVVNNKVNSKKHFLTFFIIAIICLIVSGGIFAGVMKYKNDSKIKSNAANKQSPSSINIEQSTQKVPNDKSELLAFIQNKNSSSSANSSESEVKFYDLNKRTFLPSDPQLPSLINSMYDLGQWSPNGIYLPILTIRASGEPEPFFLFDSISKISKKIYTFQDNLDSKYGGFSTTFWLNNRWLNDSHLVFYREDLSKPSPKEFIIDTNGTISEQAREKGYVLQNTSLTVTENVSSGPATLKSLLIDGVRFPGSVKGRVVGLIGNDLISLESPYLPNMQDFSQDPELIKRMNDTKSESEIKKIVDEAMKPKGNWILHFYDKKSGLETKIHEIKNDGWIVKNVQVRPVKKTILIALQEKATPPNSIRFLEIDPLNMTYRKIGQTLEMTSFPGLSLSNIDDYFNVSSDGNWLISYDGISTGTDSGISSWHLNSGEKNVICERSCSLIRAFNPEALTP